MNLTPTAKVSAVAGAGGVVTLILQLLQQYAPGFHPPSAATVALLVSWIAAAAGWLTREAKPAVPPPPVIQLGDYLHLQPTPPPPAAPAPPPSPGVPQ